jgi:hypothetical protein
MTDYPGFNPQLVSEIGKALGVLVAASRHIQDRYYKDKVIGLDGYSFTNCCFENCVLRTNTGAFVMSSCRLINCTPEFGPYAVHIIKLFHISDPYWPLPTFNPSVAPDGTVTIS